VPACFPAAPIATDVVVPAPQIETTPCRTWTSVMSIWLFQHIDCHLSQRLVACAAVGVPPPVGSAVQSIA
jgi:hypothetical protein